MKRNFCRIGTAFLLMALTMANYSCSERYLRTESTVPGEITGAYTLILYGGNYGNDIKTFAILAKEGTPYSFEIFKPAFDYKVMKHVPAKEALAKAEKFVSFHPDFWKIQISEILDRQGNAIGYELRPLYYPTAFGYADVIRTYYKMTGDKVVVYIKPNFRQHAPGIPFERGRGFGPR